ALASGVAAAALAIGLFLPGARDRAAGRWAGLLAVAMAFLLVGFARPIARDAWLWLGQGTRAERVAAVVAAASDRWKLDALLAAVAVTLAVVERARGLAPLRARPTASGWLIVAALSTLGAL